MALGLDLKGMEKEMTTLRQIFAVAQSAVSVVYVYNGVMGEFSER